MKERIFLSTWFLVFLYLFAIMCIGAMLGCIYSGLTLFVFIWAIPSGVGIHNILQNYELRRLAKRIAKINEQHKC